MNELSLLACTLQIGVALTALDQIRLIHWHKTPEQISVVHHLTTLVSCVLWGIHSIQYADYHLLIPQVPAVALTLVMLMQKAYYTLTLSPPSAV